MSVFCLPAQLLLALTLTAPLFLPSASAALVPAHEVESLQRLFESTAGYAWRWRPERIAGAVWNFTRDSSGEFVHNPCSSSGQTWQGLSCTANVSVCSQQSCNIRYILLYAYGLKGEIPPELGNLTYLEFISLSVNFLTGSIPPELGNLMSLEWFYIFSNRLTGTIPTELGNLSSLKWCYMFSNKLTGTIPPELGNLLSVKWLLLSFNMLSGTVPAEIGNLSGLWRLDLHYNNLTGTIPPELSNIHALDILYMDHNSLTGTIPKNFGSLNLLRRCFLEFNMLTGSIPSEVGDMISLEILFLQFNNLDGTLPHTLSKLSSLALLKVDDNQFSGTLSSDLGKLMQLNELDLHFNHFSGTIPYTFGNLSKLQWLYMDSNELTGPIPLDLGNLSQLMILDVESNYFTGRIPSELALLNAAKVLALSVNCLERYIPSSLCSLASIEVLSLNGLKMASNCADVFTVPLVGTAVLLKQHENEIPSCLWNIDNLTTLHLSGNEFVGKIESHSFGSRLEDVSLSHNRLSGTIPTRLLTMKKADLSSNRFVGHLSNLDSLNMSNVTVLNTQINRLSGRLSTEALGSVSKLKMLQGNMFSCHTVPENDVDSFSYICGSELYDISLWLLTGCFFSLFCFFIYCRVSNNHSLISGGIAETIRKVKRLGHDDISDDTITNNELNSLRFSAKENSNRISQVVFSHLLFSVFFLFGMIILCFPVYLLRATDYNNVHSSHWNSYSWTLSFAHMDGEVMGVLLLGVWTIVIMYFFLYVFIYNAESLTKGSRDSIGDSETVMRHEAESKRWTSLSVAALIGNFILTVSVNVLFVLSNTQLSLSAPAAASVQFAVSIFRVFSSIIIVPFLAKSVNDPLEECVYMFKLLSFNNFVIPCIVTALTSSNCCKEILVEPDAIHTEYSYLECSVVYDDSTCLLQKTTSRDTAAFVPGFSYNYQCTSVILEAYVPVLIMGFCLQLLLPIVVLSISEDRFDSLPPMITSNVNGLFWPRHWCKSMRKSPRSAIHSLDLMYIPSVLCTDFIHPIFVLMTFGVCSAPLAFLVVLVLVMKSSLWIESIQHFLRVAVEDEDKEGPWRGVNPLFAALSDLPFPYVKVLRRVFWTIFVYSMLFVMFLFWDTVENFRWEPLMAMTLFALLLLYASRYDVKTTAGVEESFVTTTLSESTKLSEVEVIDFAVNPLRDVGK